MTRRKPKASAAQRTSTEAQRKEDALARTLVPHAVLHFGKNQRIYSEGDNADAIYFVQRGRVKLTVLSATGKEAVVVVPGLRDCFGEECLIGETVRADSATALEPSTIWRVEKVVMECEFRNEPNLAKQFIAALLVQCSTEGRFV